MSETFLSRWSRRKRGGDEQPAPESASVPERAEAAPAVEEEALSPEQVAALPAVESITNPAELLVFLRKGIPSVLRTAALRRLWVLDPEIRDFVGDARDYAWDWNTPGGVPAAGALEPGADVQAMVRRILGHDREDESEERKEEPATRHDNVIAGDASAERSDFVRTAAIPGSAQDAPAEPDAIAACSDENISRRHGGALPS